MPIGVDPKVDYAFKWLFGKDSSRTLLLALLNAVLSLDPAERIIEIEILNPFTAKIDLDDKLSILDIKARDGRGRRFNIEMQMVGFPALPRRFLFYWSKLYTEQLQAGTDYGQLQPTLSICFVDDILFTGIPEWHSCFRLIESRHGTAFTDDIQIHLFELPKFRKEVEELGSEEERWLYFLRYAGEREVEKLAGWEESKELREAREALRMLAQDPIEREIYEGRLKAIRDERAKMHGMLELGLTQGRTEGRREGRTEGRTEGRAEGRTEGRAEGVLMGQIEILQTLLGEEPTPRSELETLSMESLQQRVAELRQRLGR
jgi:predicted transposase/invertase (TIGR01784 family)